MSVIKTNTEELQEILQQVYDLPNKSASGSSEPDLVIYTNDTYADGDAPTADNITFNQEQVVSTYQKLLANKDVSIILIGTIDLASAGGDTGMIYKATYARATSFGYLSVDFCNIYSHSANQMKVLSISFAVDVDNNTATFSNGDSDTVG